MEIADLPTLNAGLNAVALTALSLGLYWIRRGEKGRHRACMLAALAASAAFLVSYVVYHFHVGSVPYTGLGWKRTVYFTILITHILLAPAVVPMAGVTVWRAWKGRFRRHRRIARWTWPVWMYVSVTGILIYWMLYG